MREWENDKRRGKAVSKNPIILWISLMETPWCKNKPSTLKQSVASRVDESGVVTKRDSDGCPLSTLLSTFFVQ